MILKYFASSSKTKFCYNIRFASLEAVQCTGTLCTLSHIQFGLELLLGKLEILLLPYRMCHEPDRSPDYEFLSFSFRGFLSS